MSAIEKCSVFTIGGSSGWQCAAVFEQRLCIVPQPSSATMRSRLVGVAHSRQISIKGSPRLWRAALEAGCASQEMSCSRAFHTIQYEMTWAAVTRSYGKPPALLARLRERLRPLPNVNGPDAHSLEPSSPDLSVTPFGI